MDSTYKKRILILGGNGMIGHKIYQVLVTKFEDTWVLLRKDHKTLNYKYIYNYNKIIDNFDLTNFETLNNLLININPDIIINASGITIRRGISDNVYKTILLNSALPHFLNNYINLSSSKKLIHFSTDCVFSGNDGAYLENSNLDALDLYGKAKGLGEIIGNNTITLRGSMIGRELENNTELLEWFLRQNNNTVIGYSNVIYSGITTLKMAEYILKIIVDHPNMNGIYNVSSKPISKYNLLKLFNTTFNYNVNILKNDDYVSNKNLLSTKFFTETSLKQPDWIDLVKDLAADSKFYSKLYKKK